MTFLFNKRLKQLNVLVNQTRTAFFMIHNKSTLHTNTINSFKQNLYCNFYKIFACTNECVLVKLIFA